ncbi:MAG: SPOR domain-containing protein [Fibrobacter sp.]|jgi:hypothetical protein|nr:SPOR domain-containing protein [Fibrobacter sp.]
MLPVKVLITGILVIAVLAGCGKKKSQEDEFAETPALETTSSDTTDIFDEFYKDETETPQTYAEPEGKSKSVKKEPAQVPTASSSAEFSDNGRYVLQISTIRSKTLADDISSQLNAKGYPAYVAEVSDPTPSLPGKYYRVRIGAFRSVSAAKNFGESVMVPGGYDFWVDNKANDNVGIEGYGMGEGASYDASYGASLSTPTPLPAPEPPALVPAAQSTPAAQPAVQQPVSSPVKQETVSVPVNPAPAPAVSSQPSVEPANPSTTPAPAAAPAKNDAAGSEWGDEWESEW